MKTTQNRPIKVDFRRLQFLVDFMKVAGINTNEAARILGITGPTVRHWFLENVDDTKLSYVYRIAEHTGYKFDLLLTRSGSEGTGAIAVDIDDFIHLPGDNYKPKVMSFLTIAMRRYGINKRQLAQATGLSVSSITYFYSTDDISISRIIDIANRLDFCVKYSFTKIEEPELDPDKRHSCTCSIIKKSVIRF